ncbi:protein srg1 [Quercus suber]|uniref:Protein srg1 n=1 Tax=Quercus suber TaxID=58331 RepID=A0AAW0KGH2_QUESU
MVQMVKNSLICQGKRRSYGNYQEILRCLDRPLLCEEKKLDWGDVLHANASNPFEKASLGPKISLSLHHASKEWGFFQLINHGVSISLIEKVKVGMQEFFNLLREEKKKLWQLPGNIEGDNLDVYSIEAREISKKILELMAKALRMEHNDMRNLFEEGYQGVRMNYYPPCPAST